MNSKSDSCLDALHKGSFLKNREWSKTKVKTITNLGLNFRAMLLTALHTTFTRRNTVHPQLNHLTVPTGTQVITIWLSRHSNLPILWHQNDKNEMDLMICSRVVERKFKLKSVFFSVSLWQKEIIWWVDRLIDWLLILSTCLIYNVLHRFSKCDINFGVS